MVSLLGNAFQCSREQNKELEVIRTANKQQRRGALVGFVCS